MTDIQKQKDVYFLMGQLFRRHEGMPNSNVERTEYFTLTRKVSDKGAGLVRKIEHSRCDKKAVIFTVLRGDNCEDSFELHAKKEIGSNDFNSLNNLLIGERLSYFGVDELDVSKDKNLDVGSGYHTLVRFGLGSPVQDGVYG